MLVRREGTRAEWWRDCPEPGEALGTLEIFKTLPGTAAGRREVGASGSLGMVAGR